MEKQFYQPFGSSFYISSQLQSIKNNWYLILTQRTFLPFLEIYKNTVL